MQRFFTVGVANMSSGAFERIRCHDGGNRLANLNRGVRIQCLRRAEKSEECCDAHFFSLWNSTLPSTTGLPFEFLSGCRFPGK
jgi:hypothetical protein